jgi:hypothetical protein
MEHLAHKFTFVLPHRNQSPVSRVMSARQTKKHWGTAMPGKQHKFQSENVMGGLYFGIAFTGVNALIATGLVIALM